MYRAHGRTTALVLTLAAVLVLPFVASADEISPAIYLDVDSSGSMVQAPDETYCYGDGSAEHPHDTGCTSRINIAKNAITTVVTGYPEIRWGLARFQQNIGVKYLCLCSSQGDVDPSEEPDWCDYSNPYPNHDLPGLIDPVCINYGGGFWAGCLDFYTNAPLIGADILVALADTNEATIMMWMDHQETNFQTGIEPVTGNHCWSGAAYGDCELRAIAGTPIAGSLRDLHYQLSNNDFVNDPLKGCRPYRIILLTDGDESCETVNDAVNAATNLRSTPDVNSTCTVDPDCPPNSWCQGGDCRYDVKTYVIAFSLLDPSESDAIAAAGGTGASIGAWNEDDITSAMAQVVADAMVSELCNGADDDCDGLTDEDYPLGQWCNNGLLGICYAEGTWICDPIDPAGVICDVPPGTPQPGDFPEVCNGLDDDCDGEVDEGGVCTCNGPEICNGFDDYCNNWTTHPEGSEDSRINQPCGTDVGACTSGTTFCWQNPLDLTDVEIRCSGTGPVAEICDADLPANDQNCNGVNNDGIPPQPCQKTNPNGTCDGLETCGVDGVWTCWAQDPAPESCNNVDDDCDGATDENLTQQCQNTNGPWTCFGTETCVAGGWVNCTAQNPVAETCNNIDDNCDGATDENLTQACQNTNGPWTCFGTETCVAGGWVNCTAQNPVAETCNNIDDNCDGQTDEGLSQSCYSGPPATQGVGECQAGNQTCNAGIWGNCAGEVTPATEVCNNLDDDCDNQTDENLGQTTCGLGECDHTVNNCIGGVPQICDPMQGASPELCNNLDDDCDGVTDGLNRACYTLGAHCIENPPGVWTCEGTCSTGTQTCPGGGGGWGACQFQQGPQLEVCDGQDNDCDGQTDENLTETCYPPGYGADTGCTAIGNCQGQCQEGTRDCVGGGWGACNGAVTPSAELCDNVDNDCDGQTDEGLTQPCQDSNGSGTCNGIETCQNGFWVNCTAQIPAPESCNNIDDDCNGQTDENLTQACQNTNGPWTCFGDETCVAGTWVNCTAQNPVAETCNNIDDNCDGQTDENVSQSCYNGPPATQGVGVCQAGNQDCTAGVWGTCQGQVTPTNEICDNLDNDCDSATDEGLGQTNCGLGECNHTVDNCVNGVPQNCDPYQGAGAEQCNNLDDDCDGQTDENLTNNCYTGPMGTEGVGVCQGGTETCTAGFWGSCVGEVTPTGEVCDGLDNDCDNQTDENLSQVCYPFGYGPNTGCTGPGVCLGQCQEGNQVCTTGVWGSCNGAVTPGTEVCDNVDNDCDGQTDEGLNRPCQDTNVFGTCNGIETCVSGNWVNCSAATPAAEICDNLDNDCNGSTDDGVTRPCYTGPAGTENVGVCQGGNEVCIAGVWQGACIGEVTPTGEVCDGLDNDCDSATDEDPNGNPLSDVCYTGPAGTENVGVCLGGARTCAGGSWSACIGEITPSTEQCNLLDDDCDGFTDENLGQTTCGLGECNHTVDNCVNGVPQVCDPFLGAQPETCNGLDDDCNGITDGIARNCYDPATGCVETTPGVFTCEGVCTPGLQVCETTSGGNWGPCQFFVGPSAEICDNQDNDCDGLTDEDDQGNPLNESCYPPGSGLDTGCTYDATSDVWNCLGECQAGTRTCTNGAWVSCAGEVTPAVETCNDLDDDCDGDTDEPQDIPGLNQPCGTALGRCTPGILLCINGQEVCQGGQGPYPGECNGEDDDCDGGIDEQDEVAAEEGLPCGTDVGECEPGQTLCVGGQIICDGGTQPSEEVCDGLDNDCDGATDNGAVCPADSFCVEGACRPECDPGDEFACPPGQNCQNVLVEEDGQFHYLCMPEQGACGGQTCPDGWVCIDDVCVDPCATVQCDWWEECQQGFCVDISCSGLGNDCPTGQFCVDHECQPDPCEDADCDPGTEYCVRDCDETSCTYHCEPLCTCPPDQICDPQGGCIPDPCYEVECGTGERCNPDTGGCEADPCDGVYCDIGERCFEGNCIDDPCGKVECPPGFDCVLRAGSDGQAEAECRPDEAYWDPGTEGQDLLATGPGGCHCRAAPANRNPGALLLILLILMGFWVRTFRAAARRQGGGP